MRRVVVAMLLAGLGLVGCGGGEEPGGQDAAQATTASREPTKTTQEDRPGSPEVYARIDKLTDCNELQKQFDLAEQTSQRPGGPQGATWSEIGIAYMNAADERLRKVGCYK